MLLVSVILSRTALTLAFCGAGLYVLAVTFLPFLEKAVSHGGWAVLVVVFFYPRRWTHVIDEMAKNNGVE